MVKKADPKSLVYHVDAVKKDERVFEDAFQGVARMVLGAGIGKVTVKGRTTYQFDLFSQGKKHLVGMYDEINSFVSFVKDASEGGSSREMAYVLVGEPGNGKTFFVEYLCARYREFLTIPRNRKYTFKFKNLDKIGGYGNIQTIESQTYEDPMVLAMSFKETRDESMSYMAKRFKFKSKEVEGYYDKYRPLGACSAYIWNQIREFTNDDPVKMMNFIEIVQVPLIESLGTITGKYPAKDKITSSAVDLMGGRIHPASASYLRHQ